MTDNPSLRHWATTTARGSTLAITGLLGMGFLVASCADEVAVGETAATSSSTCRVSKLSPVPRRPSFNFGNAKIAVDLPGHATFAAIPDGSAGGANAFIQKDGWIRTKVGWWTLRERPHVAGRRLGGSSRPLRADVGPLSWASSGSFYPSNLFFSSFGCWKITATAGGARLDAVVKVVRR